MPLFTPEQSRTLAQVFHNTQVFNDLWNESIDNAKMITQVIQDIELRGMPYSLLSPEVRSALGKALDELGKDKHQLFPELF